MRQPFCELIREELEDVKGSLRCTDQEAYEIVVHQSSRIRDARLLARMVVATCHPPEEVHKDPKISPDASDTVGDTILRFEYKPDTSSPCIMLHINMQYLRSVLCAMPTRLDPTDTYLIPIPIKYLEMDNILEMFNRCFVDVILQANRCRDLWGDFRMCCYVAITQRNRFLKSRRKEPLTVSDFVYDVNVLC